MHHLSCSSLEYEYERILHRRHLNRYKQYDLLELYGGQRTSAKIHLLRLNRLQQSMMYPCYQQLGVYLCRNVQYHSRTSHQNLKHNEHTFHRKLLRPALLQSYPSRKYDKQKFLEHMSLNPERLLI